MIDNLISIIVPIHDMKDGDKFLWRLVNSLTKQTFKNWELIITKEGKMAENTNAGIKRARGEIIKILYLDDWLESEDYLEEIYKTFSTQAIDWVITSASTNKNPMWTDDIHTGNNKLGSPSALAFRNRYDKNELFDESLSWLLDCDLCKRLEKKFGKPIILKDIEVGIGVHEGQTTYLLSDEQKLEEHKYLTKKYGDVDK